MTIQHYPPRIGNTERQRPALKYANPAGTCTRYGCDNQLRQAARGYYGKFCNPCSRILVEHGDLNTRVPALKGPKAKAIGTIYNAALQVITEAVRNEEPTMYLAAGVNMRMEKYAENPNAGDPQYALVNDNWTYHHYLHHLAQLKGTPAKAVCHLMAVVAITQLVPEKFASNDQRDLFTVKRGLGGNGLPALKVNSAGEEVPHGRHSLRKVRKLATKMRGDFKLNTELLNRVADAAGTKLAKQVERRQHLRQLTSTHTTVSH